MLHTPKEHTNSDIETVTDPTTGLFNYDFFLCEAEKLLQNAAPTDRFAVFYCDFLDFKMLNDLYGMDEGNRQLKEFARVLSFDTEEGLVTRIFSDLFVKLFPVPAAETGQKVCRVLEEKLLHFSQKQSAFHPEYNLQICAGICMIEPLTPQGLTKAIDNANTARKRSREAGHTNCVYFDKEMADHLEAQQKWSLEVQKAIKNDAFDFYLQPKINLRTGKIVGAEALARWIQKDGRVVSPMEFIPMLERDGSIVHLDFMIYRKLAAQMKEWLDQKMPVVSVSLNVSRAHLSNTEFANQIHAIFSDLNIDPSLIEFELTESILMENPEDAVTILHQLKHYGYQASIDDFGSGYSSLSLIAKLDVDVLKLDKSLLGNNAALISNRRKAVLTSIIEMARRLHLTVLCEGVETIDQAAYLNEIGCHMIQGYYVATPMPPNAFSQMLMRNDGYYPLPWSTKNIVAGSKDYLSLDELNNAALASISASIFRILPAGTMGVNPVTGEIFFVSDGVSQLVGMPVDEISQDNVFNWFTSLWTPGTQTGIKEHMLEQLEVASKIDYQFSLTTKEGITKWITLHAGYSNNAEWGQYLLCFLFDETKTHENERRLETALKTIEADRNFYRNLYDNIICGIVRCQLDQHSGTIQTISLNQRAAKIFGFSSPEQMTECCPEGNICSYIAFESHEQLLCRLTQTKKDDGFQFSTKIHRADGSDGWIDSYMQIIQRTEDTLIFQLIFTDCSETYNQRLEKDYINSLYEQAGCGLTLHKLDNGRYECLRINKEAARIFGVSTPSHYVDRVVANPNAYCHPDDILLVQKNLKQLNKEGDRISFTHRILVNNGEIKWVYRTEKRLVDQNLEPVILGAMTDCTPHKELELCLAEEKEQMKLLLNSTNCGVIQFKWDGSHAVIKQINQKACVMLGAEDTLHSQPLSLERVFMPALKEDYANLCETVSRIGKAHPQGSLLYQLASPGGGQYYIDAAFCYIADDGKDKILQCTLVDITQCKNLENRLDSYYQNIANLMHQSIFMIDFEADTLTFHSKDKDLDYIPHQITHFRKCYQNGELRIFTIGNLLIESIYSRKDISHWNNIEFKTVTADGQTKWLSCSFYLTRSSNGAPLSGIGCFQDITSGVLERQRLQHLSETDRLTGLLNKVTTEEKCRSYLESCPEQSANALLIIDLDDFKITNDTCGHQFGDKVLRLFGKRLHPLFRREDIMGRIGGDEFLILLKDIDNERMPVHRAAAVCKQMQMIAKQLDFPGISCSIGIAIAPTHGHTYEELLSSADKALYTAKHMGKNHYCLYRPGRTDAQLCHADKS